MCDMVEVLFVSDANDSNMSCTAWDFRTGTNLMNYKGGGIVQQRSFCMLRTEYVLTANSAKPLLHVWPINAQEQISSVRFVVPGRVNAMAVSPDGLYLVAGIQENIYVWHLSTGRMLNTISKHYQPINCIHFTDDSSHFVTAGQDGAVQVWNLTQVVSCAEDNQLPLYSFSDHGLPVKDIHIGGCGMRGYLYTVSLDRTCKIYDLSNGTLLLTVAFPESLHCITTNALETSVFVGTTQGNIYAVHTDAAPRTKEYHIDVTYTNKFVGHTVDTGITCLALSVDGKTLVSGGEDQKVCIWDIPSRQLVKTLPQKGPVTNITLCLTTPSLFHPEQKQPLIFTNNLARMILPPEADENQVIEVLVTEQSACETTYETATRSTAASTRVAVSDCSDEVTKLRAEVAKLKKKHTKQLKRSLSLILAMKK